MLGMRDQTVHIPHHNRNTQSNNKKSSTFTLHTKFQGHRSSGFGEEDFLRFLPYMGMAAMLVM